MAYTTIDDPTIYFNTKLYTGNGSTQSITGVGFQPDWIWTKGRSGSRGHTLVDVIRGATKTLESSTSSAEETHSNSITSIDSDGFSLGNRNQGNANSETFVSWNWKAGGSSTSSNSNGSITSTVSANTTAGFSIGTYNGSGSDNTVGHGLGVAPDMIFVKCKSTAHDWVVYHSALGNAKILTLNATTAAQNANGWQYTSPSSTVFSIDNAANSLNQSGQSFVFYAFAEKKGYSKFGSYTGNGNADGAFIYLGFKPAWVLLKQTDSAGSWNLYDNKRNGFNVDNDLILTDASNAEANATFIDFLSNGFKIRDTDDDRNASNGTYIFLAFAEAPFVNSNGVPNNAR
jgi:hypothetical protein